MQLTEHFTDDEFEFSEKAIRLGIDNTCPPEYHANRLNVATHLELVRNHFSHPVKVISGFRNAAVNKAVGGSKTSAHRTASAADVKIYPIPVIDVCRWCAENVPDFDQIIYEFGPNGWMHIGFTNGKPRKQLLSAVKQLVNGKMKTVYLPGLVA